MSRANSVVCLIGGLLLGGCQWSRNSPPEPQSETPLIVDGAMQLRDWNRSTAMYSSGDTIAKPTGFAVEPKWYMDEWVYIFDDPALYLGQTVILPIAIFLPPPWRKVRYTGVTVDTTYTAMPVMPAPGEELGRPAPY